MTLVKSNLHDIRHYANFDPVRKEEGYQEEYRQTIQIVGALLETGKTALKPVVFSGRQTDYLRYVMMGPEAKSFIFQQNFSRKKMDGIISVDDKAFQIDIGTDDIAVMKKIKSSAVKELSASFYNNWKELLAVQNGKPIIGLLLRDNFQTSAKTAVTLDAVRTHLLKNKVVDVPVNKK